MTTEQATIIIEEMQVIRHYITAATIGIGFLAGAFSWRLIILAKNQRHLWALAFACLSTVTTATAQETTYSTRESFDSFMKTTPLPEFETKPFISTETYEPKAYSFENPEMQPMSTEYDFDDDTLDRISAWSLMKYSYAPPTFYNWQWTAGVTGSPSYEPGPTHPSKIRCHFYTGELPENEIQMIALTIQLNPLGNHNAAMSAYTIAMVFYQPPGTHYNGLSGLNNDVVVTKSYLTTSEFFPGFQYWHQSWKIPKAAYLVPPGTSNYPLLFVQEWAEIIKHAGIPMTETQLAFLELLDGNTHSIAGPWVWAEQFMSMHCSGMYPDAEDIILSLHCSYRNEEASCDIAIPLPLPPPDESGEANYQDVNLLNPQEIAHGISMYGTKINNLQEMAQAIRSSLEGMNPTAQQIASANRNALEGLSVNTGPITIQPEDYTGKTIGNPDYWSNRSKAYTKFTHPGHIISDARRDANQIQDHTITMGIPWVDGSTKDFSISTLDPTLNTLRQFLRACLTLITALVFVRASWTKISTF